MYKQVKTTAICGCFDFKKNCKNFLQRCAFDYDGNDKTNPECNDKTAFRGDCEFCVRAAPTFVYESKNKPREEYRVCENKSADKRVERVTENERKYGKEQT